MAEDLEKRMERAFAEVEAGLAQNQDDSTSEEEDAPTQMPTPTPPQAVTQGPPDLSQQLNLTKTSVPPTPAATSVPPVRRESPRLRIKRLLQEQNNDKKPKAKKAKKTAPTSAPTASGKNTATSNTTTKAKKGSVSQAKKGNGGPGRSRGRNFTEDETWYLLDLISAIEPAGQYDWDRVTDAYNERFKASDRLRDRESLKRRFGALHGRKIPTGDPHCPDEVKAAKQILIDIQTRCDVGEKANRHDIGFDSTSSEGESVADGEADYGEDEEDDQEADDQQGEKQDKEENLETPKTSVKPHGSKPLRSDTKSRRKRTIDSDDKTDAIMKFMMVSQQNRQDAEEKERKFRREKEDREKEERQKRDDERRERDERRAEQSMAMQQSMLQMMMQQQRNLLMLLAPNVMGQVQPQQVQPQQNTTTPAGQLQPQHTLTPEGQNIDQNDDKEGKEI